MTASSPPWIPAPRPTKSHILLRSLRREDKRSERARDSTAAVELGRHQGGFLTWSLKSLARLLARLASFLPLQTKRKTKTKTKLGTLPHVKEPGAEPSGGVIPDTNRKVSLEDSTPPPPPGRRTRISMISPAKLTQRDRSVTMYMCTGVSQSTWRRSISEKQGGFGKTRSIPISIPIPQLDEERHVKRVHGAAGIYTASWGFRIRICRG